MLLETTASQLLVGPGEATSPGSCKRSCWRRWARRPTTFGSSSSPAGPAPGTARERLSRMVGRLHRAARTTPGRARGSRLRGLRRWSLRHPGACRPGNLCRHGLCREPAPEAARPPCPYPRLDPDLKDEEVVAALHRELSTPEPFAVAGYDAAGRRLVPQARLLPAMKDQQVPVEQNAGGVVLVTGGAKGITAECVLALACGEQSRFALVGTSPAGDEPQVQRSLERFAAAGLEGGATTRVTSAMTGLSATWWSACRPTSGPLPS